MFTKKKEYMDLYFEDQNRQDKLAKLNEAAIADANSDRDGEYAEIYEKQCSNKAKAGKASKIKKAVKEALMFECIYKVYNESLCILADKNRFSNSSMAKSFVHEFIEENGVNTLLSNFKTKSFMLSEFTRIVDKYTDIVCEKSNCETPENFSLEPDDRTTFYDELDMGDILDASQMIKTRVSSAVEEFLSDNLNAKAEIKEIIEKSKDKMDAAKTETMKEDYEFQAKKKINMIRNNKPKTIFESIVFGLSKKAILNEDMKKAYTTNNVLDMDKIVETAEIMYTFLETVNTCKMVNDETTFIETILKEI